MDGISTIEKKGKGILTKLGPLLFLFGIILAIFVGLAIGIEALEMPTSESAGDTEGYIAAALAGLGFLVGLISALGLGTITKHEISQFLIGATALVAVGIGGQLLSDIPLIGLYIAGITICMVLFFGPAAVIIALKTLWDLGKD